MDEGQQASDRVPVEPAPPAAASPGRAPSAAEPEAPAAGAGDAEPQAGAPPGAEGPAAKPPKRRRRLWVVVSSIIGAVIVVLIIAAFVAAHFTSASSFCNSCHEMNPYYASWQASTHKTAQCRDCHIPPGFIPYIETKLGSLREIYVHLAGSPKAPLAVTREIPNASCFRCHPNPPPDPTLPNVTFTHAKKHVGLNCISCHIRLVHRTVNPPSYVNPRQMSSCLKCHNGSSAPNNCSYCHTPPHQPRGECSGCHNTTSFSFAANGHPFALTGAHAGLACADCHVSKPGVANIPGTQLARADPACISCHGDKHGGLTDCAKCHTPTAWTNVNFQHPLPLTGGHSGLTCAFCHVNKPGVATVPGTRFPAAGPACISCHGDHHNGLTDCASCHTPDGWQQTTFVHQQVGEHIPSGERPLDCAACHKSGFATASCTPCHSGTPGGG